VIFLLFITARTSSSQDSKDYTNTIFLNKLNKDTSYSAVKNRIVAKFAQTKPGAWGEAVPGVITRFNTQNKYIAFTFDACGGKNGTYMRHCRRLYLNSEKWGILLFG